MADSDMALGNVTAARILVVDDNPTMRKAIAIVLEAESDLSICGEAHCVSDALDQCNELHPDLALIDISLKGEDGLDLVKRLNADIPSVRSVVFSLHDESFYIDGAREAGAQGYVIKSEGPRLMIERIRSVLAGSSSFAGPGLP